MSEAPPNASARISIAELQRLMRDPEYPDEWLKPFFRAHADASRPFTPGIIINPDRVDVLLPADRLEGALAMDWANSLSRQRRQAKFNFRRAIGDRSPVLVSEGDSWFQFPILLDDVIDQLSADFNIWSVDAAGDTLQNMVVDNPEYLSALKDKRSIVQGFLFSGGGNDFLGADDSGQSVLTRVLKQFEAGRPASWYIETPQFEERLRFVERCYRQVLSTIHDFKSDLPIICHGYDRAIPGGAPGDQRHPLYAAFDQWIAGPMRSIGIVQFELQRDIVKCVIDRFNMCLRQLCGGNNNGGAFRNAWLVDTPGTLPSVAQWADELHPTDDGFALVANKFRGVLGSALPAASPESASLVVGKLEAAADYRDRLVSVARTEQATFGETVETDEPLRSRIDKYCTDIGVAPPQDISDFAWSAVFVSWCVKTAGATADEFKFSTMHSVFVKAAIQNALKSIGVFRAWPIEQYAPKVGDIIQRNRSGGDITYGQAKTKTSYPSHSAIVVEVGVSGGRKFARLVGGNERDSIRITRLWLTESGHVQQADGDPYICVIQTLKSDVSALMESAPVRAAAVECFVCEGSGEFENTDMESAAEKPAVDRVETTTHRSSRDRTAIDHIVVHYTTSRNIEGSISHFKTGTPRTSAHYIVGQDGTLVQMVPDEDRAWHAGNSAMNARSIGIEHVAAPGDAITDPQARASFALIRWLMENYRIPIDNVIPHVCVKPTSCCGDLFKAFGGGAGKSCKDQKAALHAWLRSKGFGGSSVIPEFGSPGDTVLEDATATRRLAMARHIVNFEARRDAAGHIAVYKLRPEDGGGRYEVAGINEKYHKTECDALVALIEAGRFDEAEVRAASFIADYTDRAAQWCTSGATEFYLRDCIFNRGPGGAARILQKAVGADIDGAVETETKKAVGAAEKDIDALLAALRAAREWYERVYAHRDETSIFWQGLVNRWNKAREIALRFKDPVGPETTPSAPPPPANPPGSAPSSGLAHLELASGLDLDIGTGIPFINDGPTGQSFADIAGKGPIADHLGMLKGWRTFRNGLQPDVDFEAIVERDTSLPASFLQLMADQRRAVGRISASGENYKGDRGRWSGTGFLVGPNVLLTNHHVLNSVVVAANASVDFSYEVSEADLIAGRQEPDGTPQQPLALRPDKLFLTSPATEGGLDFTFVWVDTNVNTPVTPIVMRRSSFAVAEGEQAFVIHHPLGHGKRVSVDDVDVVDINATVVRYVSDTMPGSSGSPVFDRQGRLFALHHASKEGSYKRPDRRDVSVVNEGIKTAAIVSDLERREDSREKEMAQTVLKLVQGSDTMAGFFGSLGREQKARSDRDGVEAVVDAYKGTDADIDVGFWNIEWLANRYHDPIKLREAAALITDLSLDIWGLEEVSPPAVAALVGELERSFKQKYAYALSEPSAPESKQSTAVIWNVKTVEGSQEAWPSEIERFWHLRSTDNLEAAMDLEAVDGKIFDRYPGLFKFRSQGANGGFQFYLVPLHLKAMDEGEKRRRLASRLMARAVKLMQDKYAKDLDWVIGGDFNAELATGDFQVMLDGGLKAMSATDEQAGSFSYIKSPRSLIDHIFLSSNLAQRINGESYFIVAKDRSVQNYAQRLSDHRPVLVRLHLSNPFELQNATTPLDLDIDRLLRQAIEN